MSPPPAEPAPDTLSVYAVGFFFFWLIGMVAAALCWQLSRGAR